MSLTKAELRDLIKREIASSAAREALADLAPKRGGVTDILRHPLLLALIATVIGWGYDGIVKDREAARLKTGVELAEADKQEEAAIAALNEFIALAYRRSIATDLLRSALNRQAPDEAVAKKKAYDASYADWNVGQPANLQKLRRLIAQTPQDMGRRSIYEVAVETSIAALFHSADICVTNAYDAARRSGFGDISQRTITSCGPGAGAWRHGPRTAARQVRQCAYAIMSNMSGEIRALSQRRRDAARGVIAPPPDGEFDHAAAIAAELRANCPGMSVI